MKKFLLVGLISLFGFISFSSAGFIEDNSISFTCAPNYCSPGSFSFGNGINSLSITSEKGGTLNCTLYCSNGSTIVYDDFSSQFLYFSSAGQTRTVSCGGSKIVSISLANSDRGGSFAGSYQIETSKMPISQLTPVVTGISTVLGEFIPYVIYIGLGVLIVSIAFVAVKWLMLWIYNKVRFIFKKR